MYNIFKDFNVKLSNYLRQVKDIDKCKLIIYNTKDKNVDMSSDFKDYNYLNDVLEKFLKDVQDVDDKKEYYAIFILNLEKNEIVLNNIFESYSEAQDFVSSILEGTVLEYKILDYMHQMYVIQPKDTSCTANHVGEAKATNDTSNHMEKTKIGLVYSNKRGIGLF